MHEGELSGLRACHAREGRTTAGERQEKMSAEREGGGRRAAASQVGMRKRERVACPLLRGRVEIVRERGKAEGARRSNVDRTRSGLVRAWGTSMAGPQPAQEKALSAGENPA